MVNVPLELFGERFGTEAAKRRFLDKDYKCPFNARINKCVKPNNRPNKTGSCSVKHGTRTRIICPHRFYEHNHRILGEVRDFIWGEGMPAKAYREVRLSSQVGDDTFIFGDIDWVITNGRDSSNFIGVEVQADGSTSSGGILEAISDMVEGRQLQDSYKFGLNTLDTFKTFLTQMIFKGQLFDGWKMPYVAIVQDEVWEVFNKKFRVRSSKIDKYGNETFLFFTYKFVERDGTYRLEFDCVRTFRWVELLFAYAIDPEILISMTAIQDKVRHRMKALKGKALEL